MTDNLPPHAGSNPLMTPHQESRCRKSRSTAWPNYLADTRLYTVDTLGTYPTLAPLEGGVRNLQLILARWDDICWIVPRHSCDGV